MKTPIHIFTLGEKAAFYAILENFLGWAPEPTYTATPAIKDELKPDPSCRLIVLLDKVRDQGGEIHVKHLFRPFVST